MPASQVSNTTDVISVQFCKTPVFLKSKPTGSNACLLRSSFPKIAMKQHDSFR